MCPPIEMPGIVNVMNRLRTIVVPIPVVSGLMPRRNMITAAAPSSPNTAPDAPPWRPRSLACSSKHACRSAEHRGDVQQDEADPSERRLEQQAELEQQEHVERQVEDAEVQEGAA